MIQLNVFTYLTGSRSLILHDWGRRPRGGIAPHYPPLPPVTSPPQNLCGAKLKLFGTTPPSPPSFLWCQFEAIRHHVWCRIAPNWHHKNEGGEGGCGAE